MQLLNLLCPACHTPLPSAADGVVTCSSCAAEVDVTRAGTLAGRPRFVPEIDRSGSEVGGYRVEVRLGGGGMGTVYRGVAADGRKVALKFLSPTLANSPDVVARFAREIEALTRLAHPAIVSVLGHGVEDGIPWFAMPLVEGSDLRARISTGPLPPAETAAVFGRLFAALDHAHARGVIHRDLKPANVLLAEDGARLADFGIARFEAESLAGTLVTRLTETAAVIGTLPYMSPEQRKGSVTLDRRSDLFSAGVMLYEAATGALPQGAFAPPSEVSPAYGRAFDRLVIHLLQADPARRPASAAAAAASLAIALAPRSRRRMAVTASVAALATLLVGATLGGRSLLDRRASGKKDNIAAAVLTPPPAAVETPPPATRPAPPTPPPSDELSAPLELAKSAGKAVRRKVKQKIVLDAGKAELKSPLEAPAAPLPVADEKRAKQAKPAPKTAAGLPDDTQFEEIAAEVKEAVPPPNRAGIQPLDKVEPSKTSDAGTIGLGNLGTIGKGGGKRPPATTGKPRPKKK